ncbi:hypothetical protein [Marinilabilia salmonicolor]|uniref:hypothetical protein n=1 Tax=Marinilabilia salmonicolor TaxID=989 RepID=UPI002158F17E|nr:hypothetical protein [Marinilabilia salmonicolor]
MKNKKINIVTRVTFLFTLLSVILFAGCEREYVFREGNETLSFSTDTVAFDTIFTSVGSTTQNLRVYNPVQEDMMIEAIELAGGDNSDFLMNVNGTAGSMVYDVPLRGNDSLFVFVEVNINPTSENAPFVVTDSLLVYTRTRIYTIQLMAYGQNVIPLRKETLKTTTFTKDKPYLIYDWVVVDSAETLTIEPGAKLHFHKDASLLVFGSLQVKGTLEEPVTFTSDRLDEWYEDKTGQWGYIQLMPDSKDHIIENATIRNSTMGLVVDSVGYKPDAKPLYLRNVVIEHVASQGLIAQHSAIEASNSVFGNCGSASVALTLGGSYNFYHCTIANYFTFNYRSTPALLISNYFVDANDMEQFFSLDAANFYNCIISGRNSNEVKFDFQSDEDMKLDELINVSFDHSLVQIDEDQQENYSAFFDEGVLFNEHPGFVDVIKYDYQLDSLSVARDAGSVNIAKEFPEDAMGASRIDDEAPDMGAFERIDEF